MENVHGWTNLQGLRLPGAADNLLSSSGPWSKGEAHPGVCQSYGSLGSLDSQETATNVQVGLYLLHNQALAGS